MSSRRHSMRVGDWRVHALRGFTLVELMVALVVMAILLGIAIPSFTEVTLSSKLRSYANDLVASAQLARGEAIKRNAVVTLCVSTDGTSCAIDGGWEQGWVVFHDANKNGVLDAGETVIQRQQAAASGFLISSAVSSISFQPAGVGTTQATLVVCRATPSVGSQEREVTISATGRTSVAKTTNATCS